MLPTWLRFVKGILDTTSLDLNVSREMVQNSPVIRKFQSLLQNESSQNLKRS